jgi:hypothetical protein
MQRVAYGTASRRLEEINFSQTSQTPKVPSSILFKAASMR